MRAAREIFGASKDDEFPMYEYTDYYPILYELGDVLLKVEEGSYSGDTWVLYKRHWFEERAHFFDCDPFGKFGFLLFGWGSCSGCDALQRCESFEEIDELIQLLRSQIRWFVSAKEALEFMLSHDWDGDYAQSDLFVELSVRY